MTTWLSFGDWVRRQRRALDLTQDELAQRVGCATDTIKKIETGARRPSKPMAERLADCLNVPIESRPDFVHAARLGAGLLAQEPSTLPAHPAESTHLRGVGPAGDSANGARTNLPAQLTAFVGHRSDIAALVERMKTSRLLTLTGAGGVGKTRLALAVAAELHDAFAAGVWLVELAALENPALVPQAVFANFKLYEQPGRPHIEQVSAFLRDKRLLLVLDNCEHVIGACARLVEALLRACPGLHVLATSRESLNIPGEAIWRVPSLTTPDSANPPPLERALEYEAVQLFVQHATLLRPEFALTPLNMTAVAEICHRLDGIPLAIEMAAAQVAGLSVEEIAGGLGDQLSMLTAGSRTALLRHQTLRATLDWSYSLLSAAERVLLERLSVFAGGWTAEAAKAVCEEGAEAIAPLLVRLVNQSLVIMLPYGAGGRAPTRYRLLEVVRQYATEKLQALGTEHECALRRRHLHVYLELACMAEAKVETGEAADWLDRLEREHDNLRAAIDWAFENGENTSGLRLVGALTEFWHERNHHQEEREQLTRALARSDPTERTLARAKVLNSAGCAAWFDRDHAEARWLLEQARSIGIELNDQATVAQSLLFSGWVALAEGDDRTARSLVEDALSIWRRLGDTFNVAFALINLAAQAEQHGDRPQARGLLEEANYLLSALGEQNLRARSLYRLGRLELFDGDDAKAMALCQQSLKLTVETRYMNDAASSLATIASIGLTRGQPIFATHIFGAVDRLLEALDISMLRADVIEHERAVGALRARLDAATFDAAWAQGRAMTFEQVVAYALAEADG